MRTILLALAAALALDAAEVYYPPPDQQGGWRKPAGPAAARRVAGMDVAGLDDAFEFIKGSSKNGGLLVVRGGWLVFEKYFGRAHRDATPNTASCGKSFTSVAVGILMAERPELFPDGLDQKVFTQRYFPAATFPLSDPAKAEIKLGQLLAMTAGIRGNNPGFVHGREVTLDPAGPDGWLASTDAMALGKMDGPLNAVTLWRRPGDGYSYATSSVHLASILLRHVSGMELEQFVDTRLAQPMGWGRWRWGYRRPEVAHTPGGGGIAPRSTDMLRFAYLLLREGRWRDRQLAPAAYVRHCGRASPYNPHYPYSLQFEVNTGGHWSGVPRDAFWKAGSGGHCFYVVPSLDLVVYKLGGRDDQYEFETAPRGATSRAAPRETSRETWRLVDDQTARRRALEMVVAAIRKPPQSEKQSGQQPARGEGGHLPQAPVRRNQL